MSDEETQIAGEWKKLPDVKLITIRKTQPHKQFTEFFHLLGY